MLKKGLLVLGGVAMLAAGAAAMTAIRAEDEDGGDRKHVKKMVIFRSGGSWLGVQIADVDSDRARELGLREEMGAEIQSVSPGSPAEEAGLKKGDVIQEYQGTRIEGVMQLTRLVRETPAGRKATLKVVRDGAPRTFTVTMKEREHESGGDGDEVGGYLGLLHDRDGAMRWRHAPEPPDAPGAPEAPEAPGAYFKNFDIPGLMEMSGPRSGQRLGAMVDSVGEQLAEFFGVKQGGGVLVRSVRKGGPGDQAGLKAGDVIVRIDDEQVKDASELRLTIRERRGKDFKVTVIRDRREQSLTIAAPPEEPSSSSGREGRPASHKAIQKEVERALRDAERARIDAMRSLRDARRTAGDAAADQEIAAEMQDVIEGAMQDAEQAIEEAVEGAVDEAVEEGLDEAGEGDPGRPEVNPSAPRDRDQDRDEVRRAVEEARRVRIEMQQAADE